jgi:hypothetical protein
MNVGDCGLIVEGTVNPPPGSGSGKFVTPCARMHSACLSWDASDGLGFTWASSACTVRQARWADWNAGDRLSTGPALDVVPFDVGSGKLGTPCERMHAANLRPTEARVAPAVVVDLPDDPHPATVSAVHAMMSPITRPRWIAVGRSILKAGYVAPGYTGVTPQAA